MSPPEKALLACCQRLVTVDKKTSKGRLIHFIPQEYPRLIPSFSAQLGRNVLKLPEFPPVQSPFNQSPSRFPGHTFSRLFLSILQNARKKRPFRFHESSRSPHTHKIIFEIAGTVCPPLLSINPPASGSEQARGSGENATRMG